MRADFGKGGEQVCRSRKAGVSNQTPGEYIRNGTMFLRRRPSPCLPDAAPFPVPTVVALRSRRAAMPAQNWREVYELALLELDTSKLPGRVEAALRAIQQRWLQKKETLSREEREEIDDALRALVEVMRRRGAKASKGC